MLPDDVISAFSSVLTTKACIDERHSRISLKLQPGRPHHAIHKDANAADVNGVVGAKTPHSSKLSVSLVQRDGLRCGQRSAASDKSMHSRSDASPWCLHQTRLNPR